MPVKVNVSAGQSQFPEGSDISIACAVDGYPIPRVLWYKNDELIRTDNRIKISGKKVHSNTLNSANIIENNEYINDKYIYKIYKINLINKNMCVCVIIKINLNRIITNFYF